MFGKGALIMLTGFFIAFSVYQVKMSRTIVSAVGGFNQDYIESQMQYAKLSAMNVAINKSWTEDWLIGTLDLAFDDCSTRVVVDRIGADTVIIKVNTWAYIHNEGYSATNNGNHMVQDSVTALFRYEAAVSEFFWFTETEGNVYWITGDTAWGPIHTNGVIKTSGSPTFYGKVTAHQGINPLPTSPSSSANFLGGWEIGSNNVVESDPTHIINAALLGSGASPTNTMSLYDSVLTLELLANGQVIRTVGNLPSDTVLLADIAPTKVIQSSEDIHIKGVLNGGLTIYSEDNIYLDDDIVYAEDPNTIPTSDDVLGMVAKNNVYITDNIANNLDINIQGAIMCINGSFTAENYASRPVAGSINLTGSIYQVSRGPVGTFGWGGLVSGFLKKYRFDDRLSALSPPHYPLVGVQQMLGWWE